MNPDAEVMVELRWQGKVIRQSVTVSEHIWKYSLAPLSRYHDAPLEARAQEEAYAKCRARLVIAKALAQSLADAILKAAELEDPHMGYSPEEWSRIKPR